MKKKLEGNVGPSGSRAEKTLVISLGAENGDVHDAGVYEMSGGRSTPLIPAGRGDVAVRVDA